MRPCVTRHLICALLLALVAGGVPAPRALDGAVRPADDGYHYASWADGSHDGSYTEWWYFNLHDEENRLQAILSYFVTNPSDRFGAGRVQRVAVAYTPDGTVTEIDTLPPASFAASAERADVTIGDSLIRAIDAGQYRVTGASADGRLVWDLSWEQAGEPWFAADRMTVGSFSWEKMSWLVYMPRARVTGRLIVDGRSYTVRATGYHDHNWGEWFPTDGLWNWAQFSDSRTSIEVGDFIGKPAGVVGLDLDGERTVFSKDQYTLRHLFWRRDEVNGGFYPTVSRLVAQNGTLRVEITLRALRTEPLRGDLPAPLLDLVIYEQTARYDGRVLRREAGGAWSPVAALHGAGFKEYTARRR